MRRRIGCSCLLLAAICCLAVLPIAIADDDSGKGGQYALEGSWWRVQMDGGAPAYKATINRHDAKAYNVEFSGFAVTPGIPGLPPATQVTSSPGVIERVGNNEYQFTWILWYGDEQVGAAYRGTVYAVVCFGPLIQDGPDHFYFDNSCFASINPCYFGPNSARCKDLGDRLWDPFTDPARICSAAPPLRIAYQRIPLLYECPAQ